MLAYYGGYWRSLEMTDLHLVLFFTRGVSLKTWDKTGTLEREVALYRRLQERGVQVSFVTYGGASDLAYVEQLPGIRVLCNQWELPIRLYTYLIPWLHWRTMWKATILKTNQTEGAEVALLAKRLWGKKMIARCGYMWSLFFKTAGTFSYDAEALVRRERDTFIHADQAVVTTTLMRDYVIKHYGLPLTRVQVIPNYVLTDLFVPRRESRPAGRRLVYMGRLSEEKNLLGLLEAMRGLNAELALIGSGPQRLLLANKASSDGLRVHFWDSQPHAELPRFLNQANAFILPSFSEGHPKALLEAMACGLPVIGADVPGIRELIRHGETGYLCDTSPAGIRAAIQTVLGDVSLSARLGHNAREFVTKNFSLDKILDLEITLLRSLAAGG
jgi:glycosyltransferase involved in cell wall biosynthesis